MNNIIVLKEHNNELIDITQDVTVYNNKKLKIIENKYKKKKSNNKLCEQYGGFYFMREHKLLKDMNTQHITRLAYTCTYLNYDNELSYENGKRINKEELQNLLGLNKNAFYDFYNTMVSKGIFIERIGENDQIEAIKVFEEIATKGNLRTKKPYIRVYNEAIRHLYENIEPTQHKRLGILFKFIDKIHFHYNILCNNPQEMDFDEIDPLTVEEMTEILGLSESAVVRIKKELRGLKTKDNNYLIGLFTVGFGAEKHTKVIINPSVLYKGDFEESVEVYKIFFAKKKAKENN